MYRSIFTGLLALGLACTSPLLSAKSSAKHVKEQGLNITLSASFYMNLEKLFISDQTPWLHQALVYNNVNPTRLGSKFLDEKIGGSLNINYAHLINNFKIQPYLSLNPLTIMGVMYTGVLAEYLFGEFNNLIPSIGLDTRLFTTQYEVGGVLIGIPFMVKQFTNKSVAFSGSVEPTLWLNTNFQKRLITVRAQIALHYFFEK